MIFNILATLLSLEKDYFWINAFQIKFYFKGATKFQTKLVFVSTTKIGANTTNISKLLIFTINLHFVASNQISTYRKLNLPLTSSIYLVFLPLEMQKRLEQTKVCHAFSYFIWKETTHKPLKVAAAESLIFSVYIIGTTCFDECFSFYVITKRHYFLTFLLKFIVTTFSEANVLKEVRILCVISAIRTWW